MGKVIAWASCDSAPVTPDESHHQDQTTFTWDRAHHKMFQTTRNALKKLRYCNDGIILGIEQAHHQKTRLTRKIGRSDERPSETLDMIASTNLVDHPLARLVFSFHSQIELHWLLIAMVSGRQVHCLCYLKSSSRFIKGKELIYMLVNQLLSLECCSLWMLDLLPARQRLTELTNSSDQRV